MPPREKLDIPGSMDLLPILAATLQAGYNTSTDPVALNSLPRMQPPASMVPPASESHFLPPPASERLRNAVLPVPLDLQVQGGLATLQMASFKIGLIDSGMPTQSAPPSILERASSDAPMQEALQVSGAAWAGIRGNLPALPTASTDFLPPPPPPITPDAFGTMGADPTQTPFSVLVPDGSGAAPWDGGRAFTPPLGRGDFFAALGGNREWLPPQPEQHGSFADRGFSEVLAGLGLEGGVAWAVSNAAVDGVSLANGRDSDSEGFLQLSDELNQGGFVTLSTGQDTGAMSAVTESSYGANRSYSLTADRIGSLDFATVSPLDSDLGSPLRTLLAFQKSVTSPLDNQDGGLIDIDAATGTATSRDRSPSRETQQQFSIETLLGRNDWLTNDEELLDEEGRQGREGALADAALASDWDVNSEEGGMIELAAANPHEVHSQAPVVSASESGTSPWRDIRIDKGLGRFRVLEVAESTSEQQGDRVLTQQAMGQDLPTATTNTAESTTPETSASAATEPHAETDRHAAAAPAIIGLSLVSEAYRKKSEKSPAGDSDKSRNRKCRTV